MNGNFKNLLQESVKEVLEENDGQDVGQEVYGHIEELLKLGVDNPTCDVRGALQSALKLLSYVESTDPGEEEQMKSQIEQEVANLKRKLEVA